MELFLTLISLAIMLALFYCIRLLVAYIINHPSVFRISHHRRNSFMKKWRNQMVEKLLQYDSCDMNAKILQTFPDANISDASNTEWTVICAEYKGVKFTIHNRMDTYFLLQLPPIVSFPSFFCEQEQHISKLITNDFAPIRIKIKKEIGATNVFLTGLYLSACETWKKDENDWYRFFEDNEYDVLSSYIDYINKYIPRQNIIIDSVEDEDNYYIIAIPKGYKQELIQAQNSYLTDPDKLDVPFEFTRELSEQPFTSNDGVIISPSIDVVKSWIDLYLFMKEELGKYSKVK